MPRHLIAALVLAFASPVHLAHAAPECDLLFGMNASFSEHQNAWKAASPETVRLCFETGADIEARNKYGRTPLHTAARLGNAETIAALLEAGEDIEARDKHGWTPLHRAAAWSTAETVTTLLEAGANAKAQTEDNELPADLAERNEEVKNSDVYWTLNDARYK